MAIDKECGVLSYLKPQNEGIRKIVTRQSSTGQQLSLRQPLVGHDENVTGALQFLLLYLVVQILTLSAL